MKPYQVEFLDFLRQSGALRFGTFQTKSGRQSPYFINTGGFSTASALDRLGEAYASLVLERHPEATCLYGPAYKGIPLAVAAALAYRRLSGRDIAWCFNRKEAKTHGDGGLLVGHVPTAADRVVLVDDVVTAGLSVRESLDVLRAQGAAHVLAVVVSVNRQEAGADRVDAVTSLEKETGLRVSALLNITDVIHELERRGEITGELLERIHAYRRTYGSAS